MRVLALHFDGKLPNVALGQIIALHRSIGDTVELRRISVSVAEPKALRKALANLEPRIGDPVWDRVYGSLIFEASKPLARRAREIYPDITLGGTGWDFEGGIQVRNTTLSSLAIPNWMGDADASTIRPDLSDYRGYDHSIGYTQRGCRLSCDFCVVPRKEGRVRPVATLAEIWRGEPWPREIALLDNDFFGNPNWRSIIEEARAGDFKISLVQGINARLLSEEGAQALASIRLMDDGFERRRVYTAWDGRRDERVLFRGLDALKRAGFSPDMMMVYMLIGHEPGETHADRDYRRQRLRDFGARPYPMPYVRTGPAPCGGDTTGEELVAFWRWVVQRKDVTDPVTGKPYVPWEDWWGRARGNPRKLGSRRISLPLFDPDPDDGDDEGGHQQ